MSFIFRVVLIIFIFAFIVYVLKAIARLSHNLRATVKEMNKVREQPSGGAKRNVIGSMKMVRCAACGAFISERDAVQVSAHGKSQVFCSTSCLQTHVKTA